MAPKIRFRPNMVCDYKCYWPPALVNAIANGHKTNTSCIWDLVGRNDTITGNANVWRSIRLFPIHVSPLLTQLVLSSSSLTAKTA